MKQINSETLFCAEVLKGNNIFTLRNTNWNAPTEDCNWCFYIIQTDLSVPYGEINIIMWHQKLVLSVVVVHNDSFEELWVGIIMKGNHATSDEIIQYTDSDSGNYTSLKNRKLLWICFFEDSLIIIKEPIMICGRIKNLTLDATSAELNFLDLFVFFSIPQSWQCWHYCQLCVPIYFQFSSLFATNEASKCEIRNQGIHEDYISGSHAFLE